MMEAKDTVMSEVGTQWFRREMKAGEIPCPDCDGKGDVSFQNYHGEWDIKPCKPCKGTGKQKKMGDRMNTVTIGMPLIKDLSVNHYKGRRRGGGEYVKKPIKDWQETMGWMLKTSHLEDWNLPLTVKCDVVQSDRRTRDISNFSKVVLDGIEDLTGINDTHYRWVDGEIRQGEHAELVITITGSEIEL